MILQNHIVKYWNPVHIWQGLPQLRCGKPVKYEWDIEHGINVLMILKTWENNQMEEICIVTPTQWVYEWTILWNL